MNARPMPSNDSVTLAEWAQAQEPALFVRGQSEPEPVLREHNLIARVHDPEVSRELLLKWERIQPAAAGVGFVALSRSSEPTGPNAYEAPSHAAPTAKTDPQKVTKHAGSKILRGAVPGAVIGAIVVGLIAVLMTSDAGSFVGGALGGAALGLVAGGVGSYVAGTGWSEAYKESFVEADAADVIFASIHADEADVITKAVEQADGIAVDALVGADRHGQPVPLER